MNTEEDTSTEIKEIKIISSILEEEEEEEEEEEHVETKSDNREEEVDSLNETESNAIDVAFQGCNSVGMGLSVERLERATLAPIDDDFLLQAYPVVPTDECIVHINPTDTLKNTSKKRSIRNIIIVVALVLIICSVCIALVIVLTKKNQKHVELRKIIAPLSGGDDVFDLQSPMVSHDRIAALDWMANDTFTLSLMKQEMKWKIKQRYIIALFYFSTKGQNWYDQCNFLSGFDECSWFDAWGDKEDSFLSNRVNVKGIVCNEEGRIMELRLYWNNLSGTLPYEISNLNETLAHFNVAGGSIASTIPETFGDLGKLKVLALFENCFSGTFPNSLSILNLNAFTLEGNIHLAGSLNIFGTPPEYASTECGSCPGSQVLVECDFCVCCDSTSYDCCDQTGHFLHKYHRLDPNPNAAGVSFSFSRSCLSNKTYNWWKEECPCTVDHGDGLRCTTNCNTTDKVIP